jgi:proteasome lid subunit RPN8/RPN11
MEPKQLIDAMREMRQTGTPLKAIYHSHPSSEAIPSQRDLLDANYPEALYLILSLNTEGVLELRGFRLQDDQFNAVTLETTDYVDQR